MNATGGIDLHGNQSGFSEAGAGNASLRDDCIIVVFSEMEFLPWDNPDNIVSAEVEGIVHQIKNNLLVLMFLIGGPANVINMVVFYKHGLQDRVNLCLFALSLIDELYLITMTLIHGEQLQMQITKEGRFGPFMTFMTNNNLVVFAASAFISPVLSVIIATERCLCVFNPLKFQTLLRTRTMAIIIIVVSVVMTGFYFLVSFRYRVGCVYDPVTDTTINTGIEGAFYHANKDLIDVLHGFVFGVGLPVIELIVVTTATIMTIAKLRQIVKWRSVTASLISAKELALTKILVGNSVLFIACLSPVALIRVSWLFLPEVNSGQRHHNFFLVGVWMAELFNIINATFNFFVYYAMGSRYRQTVWALFGRRGTAPK